LRRGTYALRDFNPAKDRFGVITADLGHAPASPQSLNNRTVANGADTTAPAGCKIGINARDGAMPIVEHDICSRE
jgi:hypothetical protein